MEKGGARQAKSLIERAAAAGTLTPVGLTGGGMVLVRELLVEGQGGGVAMEQ